MDFNKPRFWLNREQLDREIIKNTYLLDCASARYNELNEKMLETQQQITDLEYHIFKLRQQPAYDDKPVMLDNNTPLYDIAGNRVQ